MSGEKLKGLGGGPGTLYLVPTPLGNLGDITLRAVETLRQADVVCAEDTRRALKLLNHFNLKKTLWSYREQNHKRLWPRLAAHLASGGTAALLTDAGSPAISDPGAALAKEARAAGFTVLPLPGPSAVITALAAAGFCADRFVFAGFPPAKSGERRAFLTDLKSCRWTLVFFESPHRLAETLADMAEILGPRPALLAREMTKLHEEYLALDLASLAEAVREQGRRGEMTIVVEGSSGEPAGDLDAETLAREAQAHEGRPLKELAAELAARYGQGRSEMYRRLLELRRRQA